MLKDPLFSAKILLFGEYGIIEDSMGLSIPYDQFGGKLKTGAKTPSELESYQHLKGFFEYIKNLVNDKTSLASFDLDSFEEDLKKLTFFDSSIPQGFGVGSSGALCASVYNKYATNKIDTTSIHNGNEILLLKQIFSQLESHFHGKSSGLDPLICYLNLPILIRSKSDLGTVGIPETNDSGKGAIFLINSGTPGHTQSMVSIFLEKCKNEGFRTLIKTKFKKYNDECINAFLNKDFKPLFNNLRELSKLVFDNFSPMIPEMFHKLWKEGIESNAYYLKLCGSGGGGFILGFTQDFEMAQGKLKEYNPQVIYRF